MTLAENLMNTQRSTLTENGAYAHNTSGSALLDCFSMAGAMRSSSEKQLRSLFSRAVVENPLLALKLAFYVRDVRGGLGERKTGRALFHILASQWPNYLKENLEWIPFYGRWDDLLVSLGTSLEGDALALIRRQLQLDCQSMVAGKPVSLLAKWMPGINASSYETRKQARLLAKQLGLDEKTYRKVLSGLRSYLNVTEKNLTTRNYDAIRYEEVPSNAMNRYRYAFRTNDAARFSSYLDSVGNGSSVIHSSTLFPYDIVEKYLYRVHDVDPVLEAQWNALPDYVEQENRFLIMADVSGSMYGRPLATSVGLALYFAQRARGPFHNKFMTFSSRPELVDIQGSSLLEQIRCVQNADWGMNTDLNAAFSLLLNTAVKYHTPAEEMPASLVIITDMEIDSCTSGRELLFTDHLKERFEQAGYTLPNLVFWNVNARNNTFHASMDYPNIQLASGQSSSVFSSLTRGVFLSPYAYMEETLNTPRYARIHLPGVS